MNLHTMPKRTQIAAMCFVFAFIIKIFAAMVFFAGFRMTGFTLLGLGVVSLMACICLCTIEMFSGKEAT